jgi:hypothetical protein
MQFDNGGGSEPEIRRRIVMFNLAESRDNSPGSRLQIMVTIPNNEAYDSEECSLSLSDVSSNRVC